jgi:hypothetical protein
MSGAAYATNPVAHIAVLNPSAAQVSRLEAKLTKQIERSKAFKSVQGAKLHFQYTPGVGTIGPDRSHVIPSLVATITGKTGDLGLQESKQRTYLLTAGWGSRPASAKLLDKKWVDTFSTATE